ncbi:MAG TPA: nicotinate phosphoribosyltransferase [Candidatus Binataceae bacterium]|nr:nicotinate phosphoribosyltransferase [Candidatus Binataceae bacterium]
MANRADLANFISNTDSFKQAQHSMYPPGTEYISSYIESRGGPFPATMFVGLQAFLRQYLTKPITVDNIDDAEFLSEEQGVPFNRKGWVELLKDYDGFLPVEIEAVPEGTVVPTRNVLVQIVNTDPKYFWITNFFEAALLRSVWYPTSVGTISWMCRKIVEEALRRTSDLPQIVARKFLHDFGFRGVSSLESGSLGGMAHLVNFDHTDTAAGPLAAKKYYNAVAPGFSAVNMEHSAVSAWTRPQEGAMFLSIMNMYKGRVPFVGLLTDTYDNEHCIRRILGKELKEAIKNFPGMIGARIDSGDPEQVPADTTEWLMESFGYETNSKGFKVLPPYIRVIQGDGLTIETIRGLYIELERRGLAADNVFCGMGGGLLQRVNRDTLNFGQKTNAVCVNGEWIDVYKKPTGSTMKHSKAGRLGLKYADGNYETVRRGSISPEENVLKPVFRNGKLLRMFSFAEVIANSERQVPESYYEDVIAPMRRSSRPAKSRSAKSAARRKRSVG